MNEANKYIMHTFNLGQPIRPVAKDSNMVKKAGNSLINYAWCCMGQNYIGKLYYCLKVDESKNLRLTCVRICSKFSVNVRQAICIL